MRFMFILNPGAKAGKSRNQQAAILKHLQKAGVTYSVKTSQTLTDVYHFSRAANADGYDVVVAVGGDGTINQVINGFYNPQGKRISPAKLGVIHTGTSPDFCKNYNIPCDARQALAVLLKMKTVQVSIGQIRYQTSGPQTSGQAPNTTGYFGCAANIGLGARLAQYANSGIRGVLGDVLGTFVCLIKLLFTYKPQAVSVTLDGLTHKLHNVMNLTVGKAQYVASGIKFQHNLKPDDGRFYIIGVRNLSWLKVPSTLITLYLGKVIPNNKVFFHAYGKTIEIQSSGAQVEFDGDAHGYLPCKIQTAEDKLELITNG